MTISFNDLTDHLPSGSIEYVGGNQLKLNFSAVTNQSGITPLSSIVEAIYILLDGLAATTSAVNAARAGASPPLPPIKLVEKTLAGTVNAPEYHFTAEFTVDSSQFANNLIDPS